MGLNLKDRAKFLWRCIKLAFKKDLDYVNLLWNEDKTYLTHTFYQDGANPTEPFLLYLARVAAKSEDFNQLNSRCEWILNKATVGYCAEHGYDLENFKYIKGPIIFVGPPEKLDYKVENDPAYAEILHPLG